MPLKENSSFHQKERKLQPIDTAICYLIEMMNLLSQKLGISEEEFIKISKEAARIVTSNKYQEKILDWDDFYNMTKDLNLKDNFTDNKKGGTG